MNKTLLCFALLLACASLASADSINQILTVNLDMPNCANSGNCTADPGTEGSPATAAADFSLISEPWIFNLNTGTALNWVDNNGTYAATFGYGGQFDMSGPDGLTFTGVVRSGTSEFASGQWDVTVNYFGQWSNGLYGEGTADVHIEEGGRDGEATLSSQIAPEPSTFILLGTGLAGMLGWARKFAR